MHIIKNDRHMDLHDPMKGLSDETKKPHDPISKIIENWTKLNEDKKLSSGQRTIEKLSSIHELIVQMAEKTALDTEEVTAIVEEHKQNYKDPVALLSSYRQRHFPEFSEELVKLEKSEAISSLFRAKFS